ncbi:hypothetical protein [Mycolicibacterium hodleri]
MILGIIVALTQGIVITV